MENIINITAITAVLNEGPDISWFFGTMAAASVIVVIMTFAINRASAINEELSNKRKDVEEYELELHNLQLEKQTNSKAIKQISADNKNEYIRLSELIMNNNVRIFQIEQKIKEYNKFITESTKKKEHLAKSLRKIYIFIILYIILPLFLLSLPRTKIVIIGLNVLKIVLLVILILFIRELMKECEKNLKSSET